MALTSEQVADLYRGHAQRVLSFFARRTLQPEVAVDLMAETFAQAYRDRGQFRGDVAEGGAAWIFGIARHCLASYWRSGEVEQRAMRRLGVERRELSDHEYERIEQLAELGELYDDLRAEVSALGPEQRDALHLRVVEERPYAEVARELGVTEQTARARVSRALRSLRASPTLVKRAKGVDHV